MKLLDVVALTEDIIDPPLTRGQVGTVVEQLAEDVFEIEFAGLDGRAFCINSDRGAQTDAVAARPGRDGRLIFRRQVDSVHPGRIGITRRPPPCAGDARNVGHAYTAMSAALIGYWPQLSAAKVRLP